ncbi:hypothetical protein JOM56_002788 [Amanita muscaria]
MCMYQPLYEPPTPTVLTVIQKKKGDQRERGHQREESDWFESPNRDNMCSQEGTQFRDPEAQKKKGDQRENQREESEWFESPNRDNIYPEKEKGDQRENQREESDWFESPNRDNMCSQEGTQFRDPEAQVNGRCSQMGAWASHSVRRVRSRAMCMYRPLYEPPTPMVPTVIQRKRKATRERGHQREESDWFESPNRDNMCSQEGTQFRDPEAQVNSRCSRMGA